MQKFVISPYEDELLYSMVARYHYYSGNPNFKDTLEEFFGSRAKIPSIHLPSNLQFFADQFPPGSKYTADYLMKNHTTLPFYLPFLPPKRQEEVIEDITSSNGKGLYMRLGIMAGGMKQSLSLKYCPHCVKEDATKYGEGYFHRSHNVDGVSFCHIHAVCLRDYPVSYRDKSRIEFIRLIQKDIIYQCEEDNNPIFEGHFLKLSDSLSYILGNHIAENQLTIHSKYINLLGTLGLTTLGGQVKQRELYESFVWHYGDELLKAIGCNVEKNDEYNWLKVITRKPSRVVHPIKHLLFINYLSGSAKGFFESTKKNSSPFGKGPWYCLNPAANHFLEQVVTQCVVSSDSKTRKPVGTFKCACGFVFSRTGPDGAEKDHFRVGRVKVYGQIWEDKLQELLILEQGSLRLLSRTMGCDPKTIIKYADKLGFRGLIKREMQVAKSKKKEATRLGSETNYYSIYRTDILNYIVETLHALVRKLEISSKRNMRGFIEMTGIG